MQKLLTVVLVKKTPVFCASLFFTCSKALSLKSILSQLNLMRILTFFFFVMVFNIILPPRGVLEPVCTCHPGAYKIKHMTKASPAPRDFRLPPRSR